MPSSPFSRSSVKASAASIARWRSFFGNSGSIDPQDLVERAEQREPAPALMRRLRRHSDRLGILQEQFVDADALGILRQRLQRRHHHQRHDRGARPVGNLVDMERRPHRQQHDLDRQHRHRAPAQHAVESEQEAREDVDAGGAAAAADRLARAHHVRRIDGIADHLQREIGFDAGAHVERAVMHQRPAAMVALRAAQIVRDLGFEHAVDGLGEIVAQQDIFRRDGAVGFQLEHTVPIGLPVAEQRFGRRRDALLQRDGIDCRDGSMSRRDRLQLFCRRKAFARHPSIRGPAL